MCGSVDERLARASRQRPAGGGDLFVEWFEVHHQANLGLERHPASAHAQALRRRFHSVDGVFDRRRHSSEIASCRLGEML
jgi:hypothetical protein